MAKFAILRTDKLHGTTDATYLVNLKIPADLQNGTILKIGAMATGERDAYVGTLASSSDTLGNIAILAGPELMYDERKKKLSDYINKVANNGGIYRAYRLDKGDEFGLSVEGFDKTPAVGDAIGIDDGVLSVLSTGTGIGKIVAIEGIYYVVRIGF